MAVEQGLRTVSIPASADLSASQFCFVTVNSGAQLAVAGAGVSASGVLQDKPNAAGQVGAVGIAGITKLKIGAAVTAGDPLMSDSTGRGITATSTNYQMARALESGTAANQIITALIERNGKA